MSGSENTGLVPVAVANESIRLSMAEPVLVLTETKTYVANMSDNVNNNTGETWYAEVPEHQSVHNYHTKFSSMIFFCSVVQVGFMPGVIVSLLLEDGLSFPGNDERVAILSGSLGSLL
jgi:hypothetical protein